jgi:hypothetical protein
VLRNQGLAVVRRDLRRLVLSQRTNEADGAVALTDLRRKSVGDLGHSQCVANASIPACPLQLSRFVQLSICPSKIMPTLLEHPVPTHSIAADANNPTMSLCPIKTHNSLQTKLTSSNELSSLYTFSGPVCFAVSPLTQAANRSSFSASCSNSVSTSYLKRRTSSKETSTQ